ncbi:unnamed protein product [Rotaria sp. Silwood2]|nr:unnamed protein product [Rotaria sp. Silwood2]
MLNRTLICYENDEIQQVLLFGGTTRIPRIQNELTKVLGGIELGKSLNTDEAAAMGAVYQAATLSKGYRVKKFLVKDANQYPINVKFERQNEDSEQKMLDRTLFDRNNLYPSRKLITFTKHIDDFSFDIYYGNLTYLSPIDKRALGQTELSRLHITGVRTAYNKHKDTSESKGIKAHFQLDENCLLVLDRIEFAFEKKENESDKNDDKPKEEKSTLSKIGRKISSFFSSKDSNDETNNTDENIPTDNTKTTTDEPSTKPVDNNESNNATNDTPTTTALPPITPKPSIIREPLKFQIESLDYPDPSSEAQANSMKKLSDLDDHDRELLALATTKNNLETFIYDMRDKLENDAKYKKASTTDEQTKINNKLTETDTWLWDDGINADVKTLKSKLDELKALTKSLKIRVREVDLRPKKLKELKDTLNITEHFLQATRNIFEKTDNDEKPFTEGEIKHLDKLIKDTYIWRDQVLIEFSKLSPTDTPKYLSTDFDEKINVLKRETNYLLSKAQRFVPKPKTTTTAKVPTNNENKVEDDKSSTSEPEDTKTTTVSTEGIK